MLDDRKSPRPDERYLHEDNAKQIFNPLAFRCWTAKNRIFRSNLSGTFDDYNGHGGNARANWETRFARGGAAGTRRTRCSPT